MIKNDDYSITKEVLVNAVQNTYDNSQFYVGESYEETADLKKGSAQYRSCTYTKAGLLDAINEKADDVMRLMHGQPDNLVLCPELFVSRNSINENRMFHTAPPDGYFHAADKHNANYDVYLRLDRDRKTISFILGGKEKTLALEEDSKYTYKLSRGKLLCVTADDLERIIGESLGDRRLVEVGRRALKIKDAV